MLIPLDIRFFPILEECGLTPRNRIIWVRQHGLHGRNKYSARHETILWFTKGDDYTFNLDSIRVPQKYQNKKAWKGKNKGQLTCNPNGKNPGDIWVFRNVKHNHEEQTIHPCQFPEDMVARMVLVSSNSGEVVFDPYMGTGTVAVVAQEHGRHYLGTELDESYYEVALRRLSGQPDEKGYFPNLKTLRNYAERTGTPAECFTFDAQTAQQPTDRSKSRIFPEQHHREQLESRLVYEEDCFAADRRDESRPQPPAGSEARPEERMEQRSLLD
jgi:adenine-specific DNA-methyltransferase